MSLPTPQQMFDRTMQRYPNVMNQLAEHDQRTSIDWSKLGLWAIALAINFGAWAALLWLFL